MGSSAALSILYMEVAARLGLRLAAKPLEEGRYILLWPETQLQLAGTRYLIDPYGAGCLLSAEEVRRARRKSGGVCVGGVTVPAAGAPGRSSGSAGGPRSVPVLACALHWVRPSLSCPPTPPTRRGHCAASRELSGGSLPCPALPRPALPAGV